VDRFDAIGGAVRNPGHAIGPSQQISKSRFAGGGLTDAGGAVGMADQQRAIAQEQTDAAARTEIDGSVGSLEIVEIDISHNCAPKLPPRAIDTAAECQSPAPVAWAAEGFGELEPGCGTVLKRNEEGLIG
jgi:hypothetical protein